jgi:pimeloyl-ACP methyl ester carboxylesterase
VVMITGSGPQDRDETILGHKSFAVLANALARAGIATLRADDRGVAKSGGDFSIATEQDFAADARALRDFLKGRAQIDQSQVGYLGHSEGGIIAPMAASGADDVAFLVLIAGPAKPLGAVIVDQIKTFSPNTAALPAALAAQKKIYTALRSGKDHDALIADLKAIIMKSGASEDVAKTQAEIAASPWMRDALDRDPAALIKAVSVPVLALYGSLDSQVPPTKHADLMRAALSGKPPYSQVVELKGLNHLLQPAKTGLPSEYGDIETTMDPEAITLITHWIKTQTAD